MVFSVKLWNADTTTVVQLVGFVVPATVAAVYDNMCVMNFSPQSISLRSAFLKTYSLEYQ